MLQKIKFIHFVLTAALISIAESFLVLIGFLPPILTYSAGNLIFAFIKFLLVVYSSVYFYRLGIKKCSINGAILGFVMISIIVMFSIIGKSYGKPLIGLTVTGSHYLLTMAYVILENVILWTIVAALTAWITKIIKHD